MAGERLSAPASVPAEWRAAPNAPVLNPIVETKVIAGPNIDRAGNIGGASPNEIPGTYGNPDDSLISQEEIFRQELKKLPLEFVPYHRGDLGNKPSVAAHELNHAAVLGDRVLYITVIPDGNILGTTVLKGGLSPGEHAIAAAAGRVRTPYGAAEGTGGDENQIRLAVGEGGIGWATQEAERRINLCFPDIRVWEKMAEILADVPQ